MRPLIAVIPQLQTQLFLPLVGVTLLLALAFVVRNVMQMRHATVAGNSPVLAGGSGQAARQPDDAWMATTGPLIVALAACFTLWMWSRNEIKLHSYGFFLVVGFFTATWNACLEARRRGYDANLILDMALPMLATTILMCRFLYVALNWNQFDSFWEIFQVWSGGLSFHGAIIGGLLVGGYYSWSRKISVGRLLDLMTPSVFLGYFFGRLGCFFNGCCYGGTCDLPWAVRFPQEGHPGHFTDPSHPTQLYSAFLGLGLFFFMQYAKKLPRFNRFPGQPTLLFLALYALERAFVEIFRNGATASTVLGTTWLTQAQFVSIVGIIGVAIFWVVLGRRVDPNRTYENAPNLQISQATVADKSVASTVASSQPPASPS